jgi:D-psicose/D-tagatose/L-ribulose 3-epimerase
MALNVNFGASTWLWVSPFTTASAFELFPKIAQMGFDTVEIAVEDPAAIDGVVIKEELLKNGLKATVCGAFGPTRDLTHEDSSVQKNCIDYIEACFKLCNQLDVDFFGGPMYSAVGKARMVSSDQRKFEWDLAVKNLLQVSKMAEDYGLKIAIEPLNRFESDLVNTAADAVRMVNDIGHASAGVMLDGFHMSIEEPNIEEAFLTAGNKLLHLQVAENYRGTPGTGQTNWSAYKKGLESIGYNKTITIESFTPENKELAGAVCFWHPMAATQDGFASEGLTFLKDWAK